MSEPVFLTKATPEQKSNYLVTSLKAEFATSEAIALLKTKRTFTGDENESRDITVKIAHYQAERAKIQAERVAFLAEQTGIKPPEDPQVNKIIELAKALDAMTANATTTKTIVNTASNVIVIWSDTVA